MLGIEAQSKLYLRFQVQKIGISRGKNVFHGFHGLIVNFTGLPQKQPISRTRDTVKKEGPCHVHSILEAVPCTQHSRGCTMYTVSIWTVVIAEGQSQCAIRLLTSKWPDLASLFLTFKFPKLYIPQLISLLNFTNPLLT